MIPIKFIDIAIKKVRKAKLDLSVTLKPDFTPYSFTDMQLQEIVFNNPDMVEDAHEKFNKILNQDGLSAIKNGELNFNIHDEKFAKEHKVNYCDIDTLLTQSDVVSIHLNLTAETKGMMNKERLYKMKPESILINTSRGEIIDENALHAVLKSNQISGAGLDVFEKEPYSGPLTKLDNAILTPHISSYAKELRIQMEIEAVENLIRGLNEE